MPNPTGNQTHVNGPLTALSVAYFRGGKTVHDKVFPSLSVDFKSDLYYIYDKGDFHRSEAEQRAPGTESAGGGYNLTTAQYDAKVYAFHKDIADQDRKNADSPIAPDRDGTRYVTGQMARKMETDWRDNFFGAGKWANEKAGVTTVSDATTEFLRWDQAGSDPIDDVEDRNTSVEETTGYAPNVGVIDRYTAKTLKNHADIIDRIKYTERGIVTVQLLAALFELDSVFIGTGIINNGAEGAADDMAFILPKGMLAAYRTPSPSLMEPTAGLTFKWKGVGGGNGLEVSRFRIDTLKSDRIEIESAWDQKQVAADCAWFFDATTV